VETFAIFPFCEGRNMRDMSDHCPFLNRLDARCSDYFRLSHLQHAFKYCFDEYQTCPVYAQQLAERQERRAAAAAGVMGGTVRHASSNVVTVTIPARYAQPQRAA
jgi:hypothetical protein